MGGPAPARPVEVAAGVLLTGEGEFLLTQRPDGKPYAGYWEFPGGKVEPGEPAEAALARELREELGIEVTRACPWIVREHTYAHAHVRLRFFRVLGWNGRPRSREAQALSWQRLDAIGVGPVLPANGPVLRALALPPVLGITDAWQRGERVALDRLDAALARGLRIVMIREKTMPQEQLRVFVGEVLRRCAGVGALAVLNGDEELARHCAMDGVHLPSAQLLRCSRRPDLRWCGASCHDTRELERAAALGFDYVVLGPVQHTPSHPHAAALGWDRVASLVREYPLPVYALGGLTLRDLRAACGAGAQGVAMVRGAWATDDSQLFPSGWSESVSVVGIR
jgi:8-oxo-dGTP diphosphatase